MNTAWLLPLLFPLLPLPYWVWFQHGLLEGFLKIWCDQFDYIPTIIQASRGAIKQETKSIWIDSACWMLSTHLIVLWWLALRDIKQADGTLWCSSSWLHGILGYSRQYRLQGRGVGWGCLFLWLVAEPWSRVGVRKWGLYGTGGKKQDKVLMGKRRMACQCQKWSWAEKRAWANERYDGRTAWLINLFTSLKTLQAPLWLKFSLSSIIAIAGLNLSSLQSPNNDQTSSVSHHALQLQTKHSGPALLLWFCSSCDCLHRWCVSAPFLHFSNSRLLAPRA